ncbi:unnamed protein product [Protopolystoma xenopodis]|uniref:Uncharacterized protein n=1 Tax=Protopolystoma xenopodis TaxID=117903 RepID=A0A448XQT3_9PLAT|nr:unnamed protein product [Protopolystoma xenopodis]
MYRVETRHAGICGERHTLAGPRREMPFVQSRSFGLFVWPSRYLFLVFSARFFMSRPRRADGTHHHRLGMRFHLFNHLTVGNLGFGQVSLSGLCSLCCTKGQIIIYPLGRTKNPGPPTTSKASKSSDNLDQSASEVKAELERRIEFYTKFGTIYPRLLFPPFFVSGCEASLDAITAPGSGRSLKILFHGVHLQIKPSPGAFKRATFLPCFRGCMNGQRHENS